MYWIASKWEAEVKFWPLGNYFSVLSVLPCCIQHDRHGVQVYLGIMGPSAWANLHGKLLWLALNKLFGLCFIWPLLVFKVWTDPFRIEIVSLGGTCMHVCVCVCVCVLERERDWWIIGGELERHGIGHYGRYHCCQYLIRYINFLLLRDLFH